MKIPRPAWAGDYCWDTEERKDMRITRHLYYPEYGIDKYVECHVQPLYGAWGKIANYLVTTTDKAKAT